MIRKNILIAVGLIVTITSFGQVERKIEEEILGTWELEKKDKSLNSDIIITMDSKLKDKEDNNAVPEIILYFQDNGKLDIIQSGEKFKTDYMIKDSVIYMGNRQYIIRKILSNRLIIEENTGFAPITFYYSKSINKIEPIEQIQIINEKYSNGQLKVIGRIDGGFRHGIWMEWYESGNVKEIVYYNLEAPLMKINFEENGKIITKSWYNLQTTTWENE